MFIPDSRGDYFSSLLWIVKQVQASSGQFNESLNLAGWEGTLADTCIGYQFTRNNLPIYYFNFLTWIISLNTDNCVTPVWN